MAYFHVTHVSSSGYVEGIAGTVGRCGGYCDGVWRAQ